MKFFEYASVHKLLSTKRRVLHYYLQNKLMTYSSRPNCEEEVLLRNRRFKASKMANNQNKPCERKTGYNMCCVRILTKTVFMAAMLQAQTNCCLACKDNKVTWRRNTPAQNDTCLPCIECPDGAEPSIPCGTVAKYGTPLHCVPCPEGTYSDSYDKEQCKPCRSCSIGHTVARNCSATKNTICGSCRHGYYKDEVVFDCLPCSICCWDGKDELESQCKAQGLPRHRQCRPRHESGCPTFSKDQPANRQTSLNHSRETSVQPSPTTPEHLVNTKTRNETASSFALPTTGAGLRKETTPTKPKPKTMEQTDTSLVLPTTEMPPKETTPTTDFADKNKQGFNEKKGSISDEEIKNRVIQGVSLSMVFFIIIAVIVKRKKLADYFKCQWARYRPICRSSDAELGVDAESIVLDDIKARLSVEPKGVLILMKELPSLSLDTYERLWKRLDKTLEGTKTAAKMGDFRDVATEFMYAQEDIWELEKELKSCGSAGSPSRQLLEGLATRRPRLTVFEFVQVLQKPNIRRNDIVELLKNYIHRQ